MCRSACWHTEKKARFQTLSVTQNGSTAFRFVRSAVLPLFYCILCPKVLYLYWFTVFFYFDPPYYNKGQKLYKNFFTPQDHKRICDVITNEIASPWIITYDDVSQIAKMYSDYEMRHFDLTYSAANKGTASELMIFSDIASCPTQRQLDDNRIKINLRV